MMQSQLHLLGHSVMFAILLHAQLDSHGQHLDLLLMLAYLGQLVSPH